MKFKQLGYMMLPVAFLTFAAAGQMQDSVTLAEFYDEDDAPFEISMSYEFPQPVVEEEPVLEEEPVEEEEKSPVVEEAPKPDTTVEESPPPADIPAVEEAPATEPVVEETEKEAPADVVAEPLPAEQPQAEAASKPQEETKKEIITE